MGLFDKFFGKNKPEMKSGLKMEVPSYAPEVANDNEAYKVGYTQEEMLEDIDSGNFTEFADKYVEHMFQESALRSPELMPLITKISEIEIENLKDDLRRSFKSEYERKAGKIDPEQMLVRFSKLVRAKLPTLEKAKAAQEESDQEKIEILSGMVSAATSKDSAPEMLGHASKYREVRGPDGKPVDGEKAVPLDDFKKAA